MSSNKVLVIGTDGTRWDLVQKVIAAGKAPNIARLAGEGFGAPTLLEYQPPAALTLSEVGWSTIATGVWPPKHRVFGYRFNTDPGQATKNGFDDFLTRIERRRPELSTFLASDWRNIGRHESGGPIFSDAVDAKHALAAEDTIESYDSLDQDVADVSAQYLRNGSPDAGFVYLGVVDEAAHALGSATLAYTDAIARTDRRIGQLVAAIRGRADYARERWTILLTTDHGQQNLSYGSLLTHGFGTTLERTSFVVASGPGVPHGPPAPARIIDIAPTVLHQLGILIDPAWNLDGRSIVTATPPLSPPGAAASVRGSRRSALAITLRSATGGRRLSSARVTLPAGLRLAGRRPLVARVDGRKLASGRVAVRRGRITVKVPRGGAARLTLRSRAGHLRVSAGVRKRLVRGRPVRLALRIGAGERFSFPLAVAYRR